MRIVMTRTWRRGKRGTRRERIPRKRVTVCVGMRLENATRKDVCRAMVPLIEVSLGRYQYDGISVKWCILTSSAYLQ